MTAAAHEPAAQQRAAHEPGGRVQVAEVRAFGPPEVLTPVRVRGAGAEAVADYADPGWAEQVTALTGGSGPAVVFDGVGGALGLTGQALAEVAGRLRPVIGQSYPLDRAADAHRGPEERSAVGKTLLIVDGAAA